MGEPNFDPHGTKIIGLGIKVKIGSINYLWRLTKRVKFYICNPSEVVWATGRNIHYLAFYLFMFTDFLFHAHKSHGALNRHT